MVPTLYVEKSDKRVTGIEELTAPSVPYYTALIAYYY